MKQSKLFDILNFSIIKKDLYFESTNNSFYKNNELLFSKIEGHSCFKNNIVVLFSNYAFLINESSFKRFDFRFNAIFIAGDTIFVKKELSIDRKKYSYFLYDCVNSKVSFYSKDFYFIGHPLLIFNQLFLVKEDKKTVCNLEIKTETTLWQYSVADLGAEKVSKILGVFGETLVVVCGYSKEIERPNGQKNTYPFEKIIGLHTDTGQLLYEVDGYELDGEYKLFGPSSCSLFVYNDGETILHTLIGFYLTFDIQTGETKTLNIDSQAHDRGISAVKSASIDGDCIGFSAYDFKVGGFDSVVGVFNTKTLKIEEHYTYEEANKEGAFFGPGQPKIHGNKIYALDTKNTLHIFEREDETSDLNQ